MKVFIFFTSLIIVVSTYSTSLAQTRDLPVNQEPGKCYAKSMMPDGNPDWTEILCPSQITNPFILELQTALKSKNYYHGELDKQFSEDLKKSLINFQTDNQLPIGQVDMKTLSALDILFGKELQKRTKQRKKMAKEEKKKAKRKG